MSERSFRNRLPPSLRKAEWSDIVPLNSWYEGIGSPDVSFDDSPDLQEAVNTTKEFPELRSSGTAVPLGTHSRGEADVRLMALQMMKHGLITPTPEERHLATEISRHRDDRSRDLEARWAAPTKTGFDPPPEGAFRAMPTSGSEMIELLNRENARRFEAEALRRAAMQYEAQRQRRQR